MLLMGHVFHAIACQDLLEESTCLAQIQQPNQCEQAPWNSQCRKTCGRCGKDINVIITNTCINQSSYHDHQALSQSYCHHWHMHQSIIITTIRHYQNHSVITDTCINQSSSRPSGIITIILSSLTHASINHHRDIRHYRNHIVITKHMHQSIHHRDHQGIITIILS